MERLENIKISSGGQTGADRAALDFAIKNDIPHGGWCPKGRRSEAGPIDARYQLKETPSSNYLQRTEWNVRDSDGTVMFSIRNRSIEREFDHYAGVNVPSSVSEFFHLSGNSIETLDFAIKHRRPYLHLSAVVRDHAASKLKRWLQENNIRVFNVAGPRASKEPEVAEFVIATLDAALKP